MEFNKSFKSVMHTYNILEFMESKFTNLNINFNSRITYDKGKWVLNIKTYEEQSKERNIYTDS